MIKIPLLTSEDIEVKIKQVTKTGALALLYKTARVDRRILNEVFGQMNWTSDFKVIDDTLYCGIGIRESKEDEFVWKWEAGGDTDNPLDEGSKSKANASDAFKRAGFAVGIGEELYSSPFIWLEVETVEKNGKWYLKDPYAKYVVTSITFNEKTRVITSLEICNAKSNIRVFSWKMATTGAVAKKMVNTMATLEEGNSNISSATAEEKASTNTAQNAEKGSKNAQESIKENTSDNSSVEAKKTLKSLISSIGKMVKSMYASDGNPNKYNEIVLKVTGDSSFKCNAATEEQYDTVLAIYNELIAAGYNG